MKEQIEKLIAECKQKHAEAIDQIQKWQAAALKAEGALIALQALNGQVEKGDEAQEIPPEPASQAAAT